MTWVSFGDDFIIQTDHIDKITRTTKEYTTGETVEKYTLAMDNNDVIKLSGAQGDFLVTQLGVIQAGPED